MNSSPPRCARDVVVAYNLRAWNERDLDLAAELLGEQVIRHGVGSVQTLSNKQAVQRIIDTWNLCSTLSFRIAVLSVGDDGEHVTLAYEAAMTLTDGTEHTIGSIEIFRVVDGRIVEVYNCGHEQGAWM